MKHDVFISYSRFDAEIAQQIDTILKENDIDCFLDTRELSGGEHFSPELAQSIVDSYVFLFLASKNSYGSKWTSKEVHFAIDKKDSKSILPYRIDDEEMPTELSFLMSDINIRTISEHPIDTVLVEDIKKLLDSYENNNSDDIKTAKAISNSIKSRKHSQSDNADLLCSLGGTVMSNGYYKEAILYFEESFKIFELLSQTDNLYYDKKYEIHIQLAEAYNKLETYEKAIWHYQQAIEILKNRNDDSRRQSGNRYRHDSLESVFMKLAHCQKRNKLYEEAIDTLKKALELQLQGKSRYRFEPVPALMPLIELLDERSRFDEAKTLIHDTLSALKQGVDKSTIRDSAYCDILEEIGKYLMNHCRYEDSCKYFSEAVSISRKQDDLFMTLTCLSLQAKCHLLMKNIADAKDSYADLFHTAINASDTDRRFSSIEHAYSAMSEFVDFLTSNNYIEESEECIAITISKYRILAFQEKQKASSLYARTLLFYAQWLQKQNRLYDANKYYQKALRQYQSSSSDSNNITNLPVYSGLCETAKLSGSNDASEYYLTLITDCIKSAEVTLLADGLLVYVDTAVNRFKSFGLEPEANIILNEVYKRFSEESIQDENLNTHLGWMFMINDHYKEARVFVEKALCLAKDENKNVLANAQNNAARLYLNIGRYSEAKNILDLASSYFEKESANDKRVLHCYAESLYYRGWIYEKQEDYLDAERYYLLSIEKYKQSVNIDSRFSSELTEVQSKLDAVREKMFASITR